MTLEPTGLRSRFAASSGSGENHKLSALEKKHDAQFRVVFDAIRDLMEPASKTKRRIAFGKGGT